MFSEGASSVGSQRTLVCNSGFQLEGNERIRCYEGGVWSDAGRCSPLVRCYNIPQVGNGNTSDGNDHLQSSRNITCHPGYEIIGPNKIYCLTSGEWTAPGFCQKSKFNLCLFACWLQIKNSSFMWLITDYRVWKFKWLWRNIWLPKNDYLRPRI